MLKFGQVFSIVSENIRIRFGCRDTDCPPTVIRTEVFGKLSPAHLSGAHSRTIANLERYFLTEWAFAGVATRV